MKKRTVAALAVLGITLLCFGFFATPLMRHARSLAWEGWVRLAAKVFQIGPIEVSDADLGTITKLKMDNLRLQSELLDYRRLKDQLGTPSFDSMKPVPAAVISRPLDTLSAQYVINKGIADGIPEGSPVVIMGSVLLGFTKGLSAHSSTVETLFSPHTSVTVETIPKEEEEPARGLLQSRFQTSLEMNTIPRDASIEVGQKIVTSNKEEGIPYGMVVGTVSSVQKPENAAYQLAIIDVPYFIDSIDTVVVLARP